jgi:2-polyprenyl-3-methyl-5-hydroxy-6-metoxy-1,4-benzoquinol methylase
MKKSNPLVSDDSVNTIFQIASAFQQSKCLLTACELEVFSIIGNDQKSSKEVAIESGVDEKAMDKLLNALCGMQLLNKNGYKFQNTKGTRRFLVKDRPEYIGNMMFLNNQWNKWEYLGDAIKNGSAVSYKEIWDKTPAWIESYVDSIHWRAKLQAPDIVQMINLSECQSLLDLGCGSGVYAMEFKKANPNMKVSAFDYPEVTKFAKDHLDRDGFANNIELLSGDFAKDSFGKNYDVIFISNVLLYSSIWDNVDLMRKCYDSLRPNGRVIIQESIISDSRTEPESATILSLSMLVNTKSGDVFTESDLWMILREGWFGNIQRVDTPFDSVLITGHK